MTLPERNLQNRQEGRAEGIKVTRRETASRMITMGTFSDETIARVSSLPLEKVQELRKSVRDVSDTP